MLHIELVSLIKFEFIQDLHVNEWELCKLIFLLFCDFEVVKKSNEIMTNK